MIEPITPIETIVLIFAALGVGYLIYDALPKRLTAKETSERRQRVQPKVNYTDDQGPR